MKKNNLLNKEITIQIVLQLMSILRVMFIINSLSVESLTLLQISRVVLSTSFLSMISMIPGGYGIREISIIYLLQLEGLDYTNSIFGFVRGALSESRGRKIPLNEVAGWCSNFFRPTDCLGDARPAPPGLSTRAPEPGVRPVRAPLGCIGRRHGSPRLSSGHRTLASPHDRRRSRRPGLRGPGSVPRWHASTDHCLPHRRERGRRRTTWPRPRGPRLGPGPPCRCRLPEPAEAIPHTPPA